MGQIKNIKLHIVTDIKDRETNTTTTMEAMDTGSKSILDSEDMKKLFVSKIPLDVTDEELKSFLEGICGGNITDMTIIRKPDAKTYHFGFFTFETSQLVDEVIYKEKELIVNSATLQVNRACPKGEYQTSAHHKTKKLFVAGIPKTGITEDELKKHLDDTHDPKYGTIESVQFVKAKDDEGKLTDEYKGFGFITVSSEHLADTMSIQHSALEFNGSSLKIKKSDRDGKSGMGGRGRGRGGFHYGGGYGGYGGYNQGWGGGYGYYDSYGVYPQYGVSSAMRGGGGGGRGGAKVAGRGGKRFDPYGKQEAAKQESA